MRLITFKKLEIGVLRGYGIRALILNRLSQWRFIGFLDCILSHFVLPIYSWIFKNLACGRP